MKKQLITICCASAIIGAVLVGTALQAKGDHRAAGPGFQPISLDGYQASGASSLLLAGSSCTRGATWTHVIGPVASAGSLGSIPGTQGQSGSFSGAGCQLEYSQDQFSANNGQDTFTADVYSVTCQPNSQPLELLKNGTFNIVGGTGLYQNLIGGSGVIQQSYLSDGSAILHLTGNLIAQGDQYLQF